MQDHLSYFLNLFNSPAYKYLAGATILFLMLLTLKYLSRFLQWGTEKLLQKRHLLPKRWIEHLVANKVLSNIFFTVGVAVLASASSHILSDHYPIVTTIITRLFNALITIMIAIIISSLLRVIANRYNATIGLPIKGITQAVQIIVWVIAIITTIATLIDKHPAYLFTGLTALSAVAMLIFKDSILGLAAGFQLLLNDLVRVGDWIEMPSQRADGEVIDIMLTTVRVRNWDNTIVNIPAYDLVDQSFTNWRGMSESGGRRIKRAIKIDLHTVRYLNPSEIKALEDIVLLKDYIQNKEKDLLEANAGKTNPYNKRRLTNLGTFRAYCLAYLKNNPNIHKNFSCMVRQLAPTAEGLPLEIYAFTNDTRWITYEDIQSDIFDHLLSVMPLFSLGVYEYGVVQPYPKSSD